MINLLPPTEKEELLSEKNKKLAIVLGNVALISLVCFSLVLLGLRFYILQSADFEKISLEDIQKQYQTPDFLSFKNIIQDYSNKLSRVNNFYNQQVYFSQVLKEVLAITRPSGVYLTSIEISSLSEDGKVNMKFYGKSDTRDDLLSFKNNLENSDKIKNVYFPPNNWIKPKNIDFYVTIDFSV